MRWDAVRYLAFERCLARYGVMRWYPVPVNVVRQLSNNCRVDFLRTICRQLLYSAGGGTRTHTRLPSPDFESALPRYIHRHGGTRGDKTALLSELSTSKN